MKVNYSLGQKCTAYLLLASLFLQNCTNFSNPIISGQEQKNQSLIANTLEVDKQASLVEEEGNKLITQVGHLEKVLNEGDGTDKQSEQHSNEEGAQKHDEWNHEGDGAGGDEDLLQPIEFKSGITLTKTLKLANKHQNSAVEKQINKIDQSTEEVDSLVSYDYGNLQILTSPPDSDSLPISQQPFNLISTISKSKFYTIDEKHFTLQDVSGGGMRCFFNAAGLDAQEQIKKLKEYQNDPIVRYMIANEVVSATENPEQIPLSVKKASNYALYQFQRDDNNNLENKRSAILAAQTTDNSQQNTANLPKVFLTRKRGDNIIEELRQRACSLETFKAFVDDHIGNEKMMVALHDVEGSDKQDNSYANYTSIDAIAYINQLGIKIYQPTGEKLRLAHQFIPANATRIIYLYHEGLHFQALILTDSKRNEQTASLKKKPKKTQEVQASELKIEEIKKIDPVTLPKKLSLSPEEIAILTQGNGKRHLNAISFQKELVQEIAPHLIGFKSWLNIPNFVVLTGQNGSGKTQLLKYIHHTIAKQENITSKINVLFRGPDYTNVAINDNVYNQQNPHFFLTDEGRQELMQELRECCKWKERNQSGAIESKLKDEPIYKYIVKKIDKKLVPKSTDLHWQETIKYLIESYKDYCPKDPNVHEPVSILTQAFGIYEQGNKQLIERYDQTEYAQELLSSYCQKEDDRQNNPEERFYSKITSEDYRKDLINFYLTNILKRKSLWEEISSILKEYGFTYQVDFVGEKNSGKKLVLQRGNIIIKPEELSSGERLMLDLMSWLFYFRGFSVDETDPSQIKDIDIMLLDEPDRHLDPELCKILYKVIYNEFVQKRHIQVIMTTHRIDTVTLSPEKSVYEMGKKGLEHDRQHAFDRMSGIIKPAINPRSAISALSGGGLTVIKDVNYVLVENEDDVKFFTIIYKKFLAVLPYLSKLTELIFMPVGVSLKDATENVKALQSSLDETIERINSMSIPDEFRHELEKRLLNSKSIAKNISEGVDRSGGSSQVKKRVNEIPLYEGKYDEKGKVIEESRLQKSEGAKHHSQVIWGMIDNDSAIRSGKSSAVGNVHAIDEVYSFENYLCMPLNLFYCMKKYEQNITQADIKRYSLYPNLFFWAILNGISFDHPLKEVFENFKEEEVTQEILQKISDETIQYLKEKDGGQFFKENDFSEGNKKELFLVNGWKIVYPKIFSHKRGHDLLKEVGLLILGEKNEKRIQQLLFNILEEMPVDFLPYSLLTSIKRLQNSEKITDEPQEQEDSSTVDRKADKSEMKSSTKQEAARLKKEANNKETLKKIVQYLAGEKKKDENEKNLRAIMVFQGGEQEIELIVPEVSKENMIYFCVKQLGMQNSQVKPGLSSKFTLTLNSLEQAKAFQESINNELQVIASQETKLKVRAISLQALIKAWLQT